MNPRKRESTDGLFTRARELEKSGEFSEAIKAYQQCSGSKGVMMQIYIARCHSMLLEEDKALAILKPLVKTCKDLKKRNEVRLHLARCYGSLYKQTRNENYLIDMHNILKGHSDQTNVEVMLLRANLLNYSDEWDATLNLIETIPTDYINNPNVMKRALVLKSAIIMKQKLKITEDEAKHLLSILKSEKNCNSKNVDEISLIAREYPDLLNPEEISIISSHSVTAQLKVAVIYELKGMIEKADEAFQNVISRSPEFWTARLKYGYFLDREGQYDDAINVVLPIINNTTQSLLKPNDDQRLKAYRSLGIAYTKKYDLVQAKIYVEEGLRLYPKDAALHSMRGKLVDPRNKKKKFEIYEEARKADKSRFDGNHLSPSELASRMSPKVSEGQPPKTPDEVNYTSRLVELNQLVRPWHKKPVKPVEQPADHPNDESESINTLHQANGDETATVAQDQLPSSHPPITGEIQQVSSQKEGQDKGQKEVQDEQQPAAPFAVASSEIKFSCNRYLLFAAVSVAAVTVPIVAAALSLSHRPNNGT